MFQEIALDRLEMDPFTVIGEDWYLITASDGEKWNTMTASWGTLGVLWGRPVAMVFVRDSRYTYEFMEKAEGFTCSFFGPNRKETLKYCGSKSGRNTDKIKDTELMPVIIEAPDGHSERITFSDANMVFSCTIAAKMPFHPDQFVLKKEIEASYPEKDYHTVYIGFIDRILVQE